MGDSWLSDIASSDLSLMPSRKLLEVQESFDIHSPLWVYWGVDSTDLGIEFYQWRQNEDFFLPSINSFGVKALKPDPVQSGVIIQTSLVALHLKVILSNLPFSVSLISLPWAGIPGPRSCQGRSSSPPSHPSGSGQRAESQPDELKMLASYCLSFIWRGVCQTQSCY